MLSSVYKLSILGTTIFGNLQMFVLYPGLGIQMVFPGVKHLVHLLFPQLFGVWIPGRSGIGFYVPLCETITLLQRGYFISNRYIYPTIGDISSPTDIYVYIYIYLFR